MMDKFKPLLRLPEMTTESSQTTSGRSGLTYYTPKAQSYKWVNPKLAEYGYKPYQKVSMNSDMRSYGNDMLPRQCPKLIQCWSVSDIQALQRIQENQQNQEKQQDQLKACRKITRHKVPQPVKLEDRTTISETEFKHSLQSSQVQYNYDRLHYNMPRQVSAYKQIKIAREAASKLQQKNLSKKVSRIRSASAVNDHNIQTNFNKVLRNSKKKTVTSKLLLCRYFHTEEPLSITERASERVNERAVKKQIRRVQQAQPIVTPEQYQTKMESVVEQIENLDKLLQKKKIRTMNQELAHDVNAYNQNTISKIETPIQKKFRIKKIKM